MKFLFGPLILLVLLNGGCTKEDTSLPSQTSAPASSPSSPQSNVINSLNWNASNIWDSEISQRSIGGTLRYKIQLYLGTIAEPKELSGDRIEFQRSDLGYQLDRTLNPGCETNYQFVYAPNSQDYDYHIEITLEGNGTKCLTYFQSIQSSGLSVQLTNAYTTKGLLIKNLNLVVRIDGPAI